MLEIVGARRILLRMRKNCGENGQEMTISKDFDFLDSTEGAERSDWNEYLRWMEQNDPNEYRLVMEEIGRLQLSADSESLLESSRILTRAKETISRDDDIQISRSGSIQNGKDGVLVTYPRPGFAFRTHSSTGQPVFVNICNGSEISPSQCLSNGPNFDLNSSNVNMYLCRSREKHDKSMKRFTIHDVVVDTALFNFVVSGQYKSGKLSLANLAIKLIENTRKCELKIEHVELRSRYVGNSDSIPPYKIEVRSKLLVTDVSTKNEDGKQSYAVSAVKSAATKPARKFVFSLYRQPSDGSALIECAAVYKFPGLSDCPKENTRENFVFSTVLDPECTDSASLERLEVHVADEYLRITHDNYYHPLELFLPEMIDKERAVARYRAESRTLTLTLPVIACQDQDWRQSDKADPGSNYSNIDVLSRSPGNKHNGEHDIKKAADGETSEAGKQLGSQRFDFASMIMGQLKDEYEEITGIEPDSAHDSRLTLSHAKE